MLQLEQYKPLLDQNTMDAMYHGDLSQSRYQSFKICLEKISKLPKPKVLELGTCRSYVSGAFEGCNSDDPKYWNPNDFSKWDWGAGCFCLVFGQVNCDLTTVDICDAHIKRCKTMTDSLKIKCRHVISDSLKFLRETPDKYDLIYLDTGDMTPIIPSIELQFGEAEIIKSRDLVKSGGLILIDDVKNKTPREYGDITNTLGKSQRSVPFLLNNGFKCIFDGYQYILQKL